MRQRAESAGCIPQIVALLAIVACMVVTLLAFGVLRFRPLQSGEIRLEAAASPTTAKTGDVVTYTMTMYNVDVRDGLQIITVTDSLLGDLSGAFVSNLAEGTSDRGFFTRTVQSTDSDPLTNTVTVYAQGAGQVYSDTALVTVELLKPTVRVDATLSPATAARGETVIYTVAVANVGDMPVEVITVTDSLLGDLTASFEVALPAGSSEAQDFDWTIDDAEPLDRVVTVYAAGAGQVVSDTAAVQVGLARPAVQVEATVSPAAAMHGEVVTYTVTISNAGRIDLEAVRVTDSQLGDLSPSFPRTLPAGTAERRTFAWPVPLDAAGSLRRTVTVSAAAAGEEVSDTASADLALAGLQVTVTGTPWARAGERVTFSVTITNTGSNDAPDLILESVTDFQGELREDLPDACSALTGGEVCTFSYDAVVPSGQDSLTNPIEVRYRPEGFTNVVVGVADHTVEVFQVSIAVEETGPTLSQVGERVSYVVSVTNTSSPAAPDLIFDAAIESRGAELAVPEACSRLAPGEDCTLSYDAVVPSGEDPLTSGVEMRYRPDGFTDIVSAAASHTVEVFQPSVAVAVAGDPLSQAGEQVEHTVTISNTSSDDAPDLLFDAAIDSRGDVLTAPDACQVLVPDEVCTFSYDTVVPPNEDPLSTRIEVAYRPEGFSNVVGAAGRHTTEIFQPSVAVDKSGPTEGIEGDDVTYTVSVANTSSDDAPDLVLDGVTDSLKGDLSREGDDVTTTCTERLTSGARCEITYAYTPSADDPTPLVNTVLVESHPLGFTSVITAAAEHTIAVMSPWRRGAGMPDAVQVRTLTVCPANPEVLYAGFGSRGYGAYRSADAGGSWSPTALEDADVFGIAVDPRDCDTVYAGAWRDGVWRSDDGGRSWDAAAGGLEGTFVYSVVVDPTDANVLYAGTAERGVYRSDDAGATWRAWTLAPLAVPHLSVTLDGQAVYAATWGDGVYRRGRSGADWGAWNAVNDGIPGEHREIFAVVVDPEDGATVFAATYAGGVYRSLDGGGTWDQVLSSPRTAYAVAVEPGGSDVVYAGTDEGVYRSAARGEPGSWQPFNAGLEGLAVRSLAVGPEEAEYVHLGSADGAWRHVR